MNHQRLRIADIGDMAGQVHRLDQGATCLAPTLDPETEDRTRALRQVLLRALEVDVRRQSGPVDELDSRVGFEPLCDDPRVGDVRIHPERKCFNALGQQERGVRGEDGADVAQLLRTQAGEEGVFAEVARPVEVAVGVYGNVEQRELVAVPVESAGFDHDAAHGGSVPAEELGRRVDDDVGPPLHRTVEVGRGEGRVDDEGDSGRVGDVGETLQVGDLTGRVGDRLGEDQLGLVGDCGRVVCRIRAGNESGVDTETAQGHVELGYRSAVESRGCDDVLARAHQRCKGDVLRGQAARGRDRADAALEARDPFLECRNGGVGDPGVDVAVLLQGEPGRRIRCVVEHESRGLVDGEGSGARHRIRNVACVDGAGAEAPFPVCTVCTCTVCTCAVAICHAITLPEQAE